MSLADLAVFRMVATEGGVSRAARRLHRVQSGVTTRVQQLEDDLGVALFLREGKRMQLSPAGQVLLGYAQRLLELAGEARDAVRDSRPRGLFRVGAMESTAAVRLPAVLTEYHRRHPEVVLDLRTGNPRQLAAAIRAGELDAAFAAEPIPDGPFEKVPAYDEELVIVSGRDRSLDFKQRATLAMVAFEDGCPHRKRLEDWYAAGGALPDRIVEMTSYHAMLGCIVAGMGIALLPRSVLATFPARNRLRVHALPRGHDVARTVLFWRKGARSPKVDALAQIAVKKAPVLTKAGKPPRASPRSSGATASARPRRC
jgi:DNA-binding transcriptional LysR family regulator